MKEVYLPDNKMKAVPMKKFWQQIKRVDYFVTILAEIPGAISVLLSGFELMEYRPWRYKYLLTKTSDRKLLGT